jgi:hypothetical protein
VGGVPQFHLVTRIHVLSAIREHDQLGADAFLSTYGFGPAREYVLKHRGRSYDSRAILGVAHRYATGTPARSDEFSGGKDGAVKWLESLDFEVVYVDPNAPPARSRPRPSSSRPTTARKPAAARKPPARPAKPEPVVALCPRCFTQLPATGVCDYCD